MRGIVTPRFSKIIFGELDLTYSMNREIHGICENKFIKYYFTKAECYNSSHFFICPYGDRLNNVSLLNILPYAYIDSFRKKLVKKRPFLSNDVQTSSLNLSTGFYSYAKTFV